MRKTLKSFYKNVIAGFGRGLGYALLMVCAVLLLKAMGLAIDFTTFPPSIQSEVIKTITK